MRYMHIFLRVICLLLFSSCISFIERLENQEGNFYDVSTGKMEFGLLIGRNEGNVQEYENDPGQERLKYLFRVDGLDIIPTIKINSFSFTDKEGNIIPSVLYCRTKGADREVYIIESLPVLLTIDFANDMQMYHFYEEMKIYDLNIFAECSLSYIGTKSVYINYDIEVEDMRFVKQCKYRRRLILDWRGWRSFRLWSL